MLTVLCKTNGGQWPTDQVTENNQIIQWSNWTIFFDFYFIPSQNKFVKHFFSLEKIIQIIHKAGKIQYY